MGPYLPSCGRCGSHAKCGTTRLCTEHWLRPPLLSFLVDPHHIPGRITEFRILFLRSVDPLHDLAAIRYHFFERRSRVIHHDVDDHPRRMPWPAFSPCPAHLA